MDEKYLWSITLFLRKTYTTWSVQESGAVLNDRRTAERRIMQVNNRVNSGYSTAYYRSPSVKKSDSFIISEDNYSSNETVKKQRSTQKVNYLEFYKAQMLQKIDTVRDNKDSIMYSNDVEQSENSVEIDIDFSRFATNAPDEVRQAFMDAAKETGYYEGERMDYISQVLVHQVENRQNGVSNYTDVFGSTIASALQVAREILYDLENPLMPISQRGENVAKYVEQEKEFYKVFIEKLENI